MGFGPDDGDVPAGVARELRRLDDRVFTLFLTAAVTAVFAVAADFLAATALRHVDNKHYRPKVQVHVHVTYRR